jgi:phosphoribosylformylglycinamidine synthase
VVFPIAHGDGNYFIDEDGRKRLEDEERIAFRYCDATGQVTPEANPNGSVANIAGIYNRQRNVLGMMPHPERLADPALGGTDGVRMFDGLVEALS